MEVVVPNWRRCGLSYPRVTDATRNAFRRGNLGGNASRTLFIDEDELFYHALEKARSEVAGDRETANRSDEQHDSRREMFRIQEELMARIKTKWGARVARKHAEVLRRRPFDDAAVARLNRFNE